ncbi:MAG: hypothetical protein IJ864_04275 [Alphaproteobacteria bacterium]|nr:hypothetical protein [Alphaproteobacteria bacterium]
MSSQGLQQQLYEDGLSVAKIIFAYIAENNIVSVHEKLSGQGASLQNDKEVYQIGRAIARLHKLTASAKYKKSYLLLPYPNLLGRVLIAKRAF